MRRKAGVRYRILSVMTAAAVLAAQTDVAVLAAGADEKTLAAGADETVQTGGKAEAVYIDNEEDFYLLTEQCRTEGYSAGKFFYLEKDLDLSDYEELFIPVMAGYFDGQGHRITGLSFTEATSDYGLFRYVSASGTVCSLTVEASVISDDEQEHIGILAGSNAGSILDCVSRGSINAQSSVGGIVGINEETGSILRCRNEAQIDGKDKTGGIAGNNEGEISDCVNAGNINTNQKVARQIDGDGSVTVSIPDAVTGVVADERANDTGGIAGISSGTISHCTNEGTIGHEHLGSATGGIVGRQNGGVSYCTNAGYVYGHKDVGGIAGYFEPYEAASYDRDYTQELEDQLDELSDLMDGLSDIGDRMGDSTSDNLDELSDKIKELRDSLRTDLDDFGDLTDDSRDVIRSQTDAVRDALDKVEMDTDLDQLEDHISKIEKDMAQMRSILETLTPNLGNADDLAQIIARYQEQLQKLEQLLEMLKQYIGQTGGGSTGGSTQDKQRDEDSHSGSGKPQSEKEEEDMDEDADSDEADDEKDADAGEEEETDDTAKEEEDEGDETPSDEENGDAGSDSDEGSGDADSGRDEENAGQDTDSSEADAGKDADDEKDADGDSGKNPSGAAPDVDSGSSAATGKRTTAEKGTMQKYVFAGDSGDSGTGSRDDGADSGTGTGGDDGTGTGGDNGTGSGGDDGTGTGGNGDTDSGDDDQDGDDGQGGDGSQGGSGQPGAGENPGSAQIAEAIRRLNALSADIRKQVNEITDILGGLPDEFSDLQDDFEEAGDRIGDLADTLDDEISKWSDELGTIKDDIRVHSDSISDTVDQTTDTLDADMDAFSDQLDRIKDKFSEIRATISDSFDELKNTIEDRSVYVDVSELADKEPGKGRLISCTNTGEILADSQAGGIIGTIAKVSGSDMRDLLFDNGGEDEDDEDEKDSITKHVVALVADCKNSSQISVQDDYAGGIVGKADYGALLSCENYGDVVSEEGGYVGGIAGKAEHSIRDSYVLCGLSGDSYIGGVAGSGEDISGSYVCAYMDMEDYVKSCGAIAGTSDGTVENNYFADNGCGAVDGVTRSREATGVDYAAMLELQEMPEEFTIFTIRFQDLEKVVWEENFSYGDVITREEYPQLTEPEGEYAYWEDKTISPVHRNVTVHAVYRVYVPSLAAKGTGDNTDILLGGDFYPDSTLAAREASQEETERVKQAVEALDMPESYLVQEVYYYELDQEEALKGQVSLRVKDGSKQPRSLMVLSEGLEVTGEAQEAEMTDSYMGVDTTIGSSGYVVVLESVQTRMTAVLVTGAAILFVLLAICLLCRRRRKRSLEHTEKAAESVAGNPAEDAQEKFLITSKESE